jgi:hypothetical protein
MATSEFSDSRFPASGNTTREDETTFEVTFSLTNVRSWLNVNAQHRPPEILVLQPKADGIELSVDLDKGNTRDVESERSWKG